MKPADTTNHRPWSLLRHWLFSFAGAFLLLVILANASLYYLVNRGLMLQRNARVLDRIEAIGALLKSPANGQSELQRRVEDEWPKRAGEKIMIEVVDQSGQAIVASPGLPARLHERFLTEWNTDSKPKVFRFEDEEGAIFWGQTQISENAWGRPGPIRIGVAIGDEQGREFLSTFRDLLLFVTLLSVVLGLATGGWVASKGIQPLEAMALEVGHIDTRNFARRLQLQGLPRELQTLTDAFNQTLDRLQDAFEKISRFSSDIAHELRTPIASLRGEIEVSLTKDRTAEESRETMVSLLEECSRLQNITDSLLFLARAESGQPELPWESLSAKDEIQSLLDFFEPQASEKGVQLGFLPDTQDIRIRAQGTLLQRALANLISNALQYTPSGGSISIGLEAKPDHAEIWVQDTGPGMKAEDTQKIFDRFYRVDPSRNPNSGGLGLGLAIVKSIMDLHQGRVRVASQEGQGSRFILEWPLGSRLPG